MSAYEVLQFLQLSQADAANAICGRAREGLIKARAKLFISQDVKQRDVDIPAHFWSPKEGSAADWNWTSGDFETWMNHPTYRLKAFGVEFRRSDIEQLKPWSAARTRPPSGARVLSPVEQTSPLNPSRHARFSSFMVGMRMQRMRSLCSSKNSPGRHRSSPTPQSRTQSAHEISRGSGRRFVRRHPHDARR
jgi:hypothetical protein